MNLRPYQSKAVEEIRDQYRNGKKSTLLVLPTGGGKTIVFSYICKAAIDKNKKVLILVHRDSLFKQTSKTLQTFNVQHGLIGAGYSANYNYTCQVAKIGSLINRMQYFNPDLIIVDEAHHAVSPTYKKIIQYYNKASILGVTATPCRTDGTGLGDVFNSIVIGSSIQELTDLGYLVRPRIFIPPNNLQLGRVKVTAGDYNKKELEQEINKSAITGNAVEHYRMLCDGVPAVVFCVSVKHSIDVANEFKSAGYSAESIDGSMQQKDIDRILSDLASSRLQIVTSCDLISEGTDIPAIGCAILLRPTKSESLYLQQVGRALRTCDGKDSCIILDHVNNVKDHGHPLADRDWSLDGKKKKKKKDSEPDIKFKVCQKCYFVHNVAKCPECGFINENKNRKMTQLDGILVELDKIEKKNTIKSATTFEELRLIEKKFGYKKGWAWHRWNAIKKKIDIDKLAFYLYKWEDRYKLNLLVYIDFYEKQKDLFDEFFNEIGLKNFQYDIDNNIYYNFNYESTWREFIYIIAKVKLLYDLKFKIINEYFLIGYISEDQLASILTDSYSYKKIQYYENIIDVLFKIRIVYMFDKKHYKLISINSFQSIINQSYNKFDIYEESMD
jgi:DNA repair protein RadD